MKKITALFVSLFLVVLGLGVPKSVQAGGVQVNPIVWRTSYNELSSSNFHIRVGDQYFYGKEPMRITADAGVNLATLENIWQENGVEMRLFMYFKKIDQGMWEMYDLRAYNGKGGSASDWIYYSPADSLGNKITSLVGHRNFAGEERFLPLNRSIDAEIYCKDCSITAFTTEITPLSSYGYGIDFRIGLPKTETITLSTNPRSGYGVNASLVDSSQTTVKNQAGFLYVWKVENDAIATIMSQSIPYPDNKCAYDIVPPCPPINVQITGKSPGVTRVMLDVIRVADNITIASNSFPVKIIPQEAQLSTPSITPSPMASVYLPSPSPSQSSEVVALKQELSQLRGEVGQIKTDVATQKKDISGMQKILAQLQAFFRRFLGR